MSSDQGATWVQLVEEGGDSMFKRWGHSGIITSGGVLVVFGGSNTDSGLFNDMYSYRDLWASFDGGISWLQCTGDGSSGAYDYFRTEQGVTLTNDEELVLLSGYSFCPQGRCTATRYDYRDVWKTPFSLGNTALLAQMCSTDVPASGAGLARWPRPPVIANSFGMTVQTRRAPWSARIQPAVLLMSRPIDYLQAGTKLRISTPPNWLLLYEGSLTYAFDTPFQSNENDIHASADNGATSVTHFTIVSSVLA